MGRRYDTVSFLSDYGSADEHVGVVKAIVRDMAPHAQVIDLTHDIPLYDVRAGSLALARAIGYVPAGVVMAVVDADARRAVAIEVADGAGVVIGPDNGVLASAISMAGGAGRSVVLDNVEFQLASPGASIVGRDVFAPIAAHLCNGVDLADLGRLVDADELLPGVVPLPRDADDGGVHAEVLWIDRAGNCQLNIGLDDVAPWGVDVGVRLEITAGEVVRVAQRVARVGGLGPGSIGFIVDGFGLLTLVLERRSAADELALATADQVLVRPLTEGSNSPGVSVPVSLSQPRR
ncbi:MAG TPA: SAM-dependent chlorinase/fluorinase [Ilumatobacteraceae bacterium]|nr:SAM-dependent chlorinase/fluorinase [Ilumatobacteraceae bacterium]HRB04383.1 SAM-dependent chlorinase/fluorinase [Ilumatobacteraceae bacterium]